MPAGFMFRPTDEQLLIDYLLNKVMGNPLPFQGIVVECCDLYGSKKPWEIWDEHSHQLFDCNQDLYMFTKLNKINPNGSRISRKLSTDSKGSWKGETAPKEVRGKSTGSVIGVLKKFRYEEKLESSKHDAHWLMHEYSLSSSLLPHAEFPLMVICRIRRKELAPKNRKLSTVENNLGDNGHISDFDDQELIHFDGGFDKGSRSNTSAAPMPAGFMFRPTDEQLLLDYLRNKVMGNPLPFQGIVVEYCDIYGSKKPWEIWDEHRDKRFDCDQDLYLFTKLNKINPNGSRISRKLSIDSKGSWEGETTPMEVRGKLTGSVIGVLKKFRYEEKLESNKHDVHWLMHEYSLHSSLLPPAECAVTVICRIRRKELLPKNRNLSTDENNLGDNGHIPEFDDYAERVCFVEGFDEPMFEEGFGEDFLDSNVDDFDVGEEDFMDSNVDDFDVGEEDLMDSNVDDLDDLDDVGGDFMDLNLDDPDFDFNN